MGCKPAYYLGGMFEEETLFFLCFESLQLILVDLEESKKYFSHKEFKNIQMSVFDRNERKELRIAPAFPWEVSGTRWYNELK